MIAPIALLLVALLFGCGGGGGSDGGGDAASTSGTLAFQPSALTVAEDGYVYLLDEDSDKLYRWSMETESYAKTVNLGPGNDADNLVFSSAHDRLYLGWRTGRIKRIDAPRGVAPSVEEYENLADGVDGLFATGDFLGVRSGTGSSGRLRTFDAAGALVAISDRLGGDPPQAMVYMPGLGRLYSYANDTVGYLDVNPESGAIGTTSAVRRQGRQRWGLPLVVSSSGNRIALGSGHILNEAFETVNVLPHNSVGGVYLDDDSLLLIQAYDEGSRTRLEHRDAAGALLNQQLIEGRPIHIARAIGKTLVVTLSQRGRPQFTTYEPNTDGDGDGVPFSSDAFPLDPAASTDTDGDGAPDAWNPGQSRKHSVLDLEIDAFPLDTACQNSNQAMANDQRLCDIAGATPAYIPRKVVGSEDGIVYVLGRTEARVFRWSALSGEHLNPIVVSEDARFLTYSNRQNRLYIGYEDGRITTFDPAAAAGGGALRESHFRRLPAPLRSLIAVDDFLVIYGGGLEEDWPILDDEGESIDPDGPGSGIRLEFIPDLARSNPGPSQTIELGPLTGEPGREATYFLSMSSLMTDAFHVSKDGGQLAFEDGSFRDGQTLSVIARIPLSHDDALWFPNGSFAAIRNWAGQTRIEVWDADRRPVDLAHYAGFPYAIVEAAGRSIVVSRTRDSATTADPDNASDEGVVFREYLLGVDGDGDGVSFENDAFPYDPATSSDSDHDGFPDQWNPGYTGSVVSPRFGIDVFPFDSACWIAAQALPGQPEECDIDAQVGNYRPKDITADPSGIVYLLNAEFRTIDRYSLTDESHLNPIRIESSSALSIAYSAETDRLYISYANGRIDWVAGGEPAAKPRFLRTMLSPAWSLLPVRELILAYAPGSDSGLAYHSISSEGALIDSSTTDRGSRSFEFNAELGRIYHAIDGSSLFNLVRWESFDPVSGLFGNGREWRHDFRDYDVESPLRVAPDGSAVILATGNVFEGDDLDWRAALPAGYKDASWLPGNRLVTLAASDDGNSRATLWNSSLQLQATNDFAGEPLGLFDAGGTLAVVRLLDGRPTISVFEPSDDSDSDGVLNDEDDFPVDVSASIDTDGDGAPDAWNSGYGPSDSSEGLALDAFPNDPECQIPEHGRDIDPLVCDIEFGIPPYVPTNVVLTNEGVAHAFSPENKRIYRWSISEDHPLDPIAIDRYAQHLAYSPDNNRLYVSYLDGTVTQINPRPNLPVENLFRTLAYRPLLLHSAGPNLIVVSSTAPFSTGITHQVFDGGGSLRSTSGSRSSSDHFEWSPGNDTIYYSRGASGTGSLEAQTLNPTTGVLGPIFRPPYIPSPAWRAPVRAARDGSIVAMGNGWFHDGMTLDRIGRLPTEFTDAVWLDDGTLMTLRDTEDGNAIVEQWASNRERFTSWPLSGAPLRITSSPAGVVSITLIDGKPKYETIFPLQDGDEDGIVNGADAFPTDPAASVDSDGDGAPDMWNSGTTASDSTLGLILDAFPNDPTCQDASHAYPLDPTVCDFARSIAPYEPDDYAIDARGTVYFLNGDAALLRRWSGPDDYHIPPIEIGVGVTHLAYSADNDRLYLGYPDGTITQLDPNDPARGEFAFAATPGEILYLVATDDHIFAVDPAGVEFTAYLFPPGGGPAVTTAPRSPYTNFYEWSSAARALFYPNRNSANQAVAARPIDTTTGTIDLPRPSDTMSALSTREPIRISEDGLRGVSRTGNAFDVATLTLRPGLPEWFVDGDWTSMGTFVAIRDLPSAPAEETLLEEWSADLSALLQTNELLGNPLRVLSTPGFVQVVLLVDGRPEVISY